MLHRWRGNHKCQSELRPTARRVCQHQSQTKFEQHFDVDNVNCSSHQPHLQNLQQVASFRAYEVTLVGLRNTTKRTTVWGPQSSSLTIVDTEVAHRQAKILENREESFGPRDPEFELNHLADE